MANEMINGIQCTNVWHVNGVWIFRVDSKAVYITLEIIQKKRIKEQSIKSTQRKVHEYLGMTINLSIPGKVNINMPYRIKNMVD